MNVMLLAAGRGTRLQSVAPDVPKALVEIGGESLLARQLRYLEGQGVSRVVVNAFFMADQVLAFARAYKGSLDLTVVVEAELLGTAGGVRNALPQLGSEPFIVLYGDVLTAQPLMPLLASHAQQAVVATLAVYESVHTEGKGTVQADSSGLVVGFAEKSPHATDGSPQLINAGIYVVEPNFAQRIPSGVSSDFGHDLFPDALARGERLGIYRLPAPVLDIGTPSTLALARAGGRLTR